MSDRVSVGTDFPREQERVRKLREGYLTIGPNGAFGALNRWCGIPRS